VKEPAALEATSARVSHEDPDSTLLHGTEVPAEAEVLVLSAETQVVRNQTEEAAQSQTVVAQSLLVVQNPLVVLNLRVARSLLVDRSQREVMVVTQRGMWFN
jgi:hypothetical protein